ncbi:FecR family protein [Leeuwenhoekiella sp. MAR_2009_132]|uniref:FecR family protein n=1 Tax=Leeuwenhoekiella sp. MAR_2009_132 TaxID=1392489 RepID=UPI000490B8E3|nr:FecR domain-containing protein [Leeuwenhoekiella sp. MAR_2009_132]
MKKEINLLIKKLNGTLTPEESVLFDLWNNESADNKHFFNKISTLKLRGADIEELQNLDTDQAWEIVLSKVKDQKPAVSLLPKKKIKVWHYAAAAVIAILITFNFVYRPFADAVNTQNALSVETENGAIEVIRSNKQIQLFDKKGIQIASQNADTLSYTNSTATTEIAYNTLNVPNGNSFTLKLGDGSVIRLNAGSRLTYPINFKPGTERLLTLKGEAYFDVSKQKNQPFIISTQGLNVEVLGTSFNVNSYAENNLVAVALVEGSVQMYNDSKIQNQSVVLKPNQLGSFNPNLNSISVQQANMWEHTAWLEGRLIIRDASFTEILQKIERKYAVTIINKNTTINKERFNASFDTETVDEVLEAFALDAPFKFTHKENVIIINNL